MALIFRQRRRCLPASGALKTGTAVSFEIMMTRRERGGKAASRTRPDTRKPRGRPRGVGRRDPTGSGSGALRHGDGLRHSGALRHGDGLRHSGALRHTERAGAAGLYAVAFVAGFVDVDAITLSSLNLFSDGSINAGVAVTAAGIAYLAAAAFKLALLGFLGGRGMLLQYGPLVFAPAFGVAAGLVVFAVP